MKGVSHMKAIAKKAVRGFGILLLFATTTLGIVALRFAVFAPEVLNRIFTVIGG